MAQECVNPRAPVMPCCVCGEDVHTCERVVGEGFDYRCPAHPNGAETEDGRWVCSQQCWETYAAHKEKVMPGHPKRVCSQCSVQLHEYTMHQSWCNFQYDSHITWQVSDTWMRRARQFVEAWEEWSESTLRGRPMPMTDLLAAATAFRDVMPKEQER